LPEDQPSPDPDDDRARSGGSTEDPALDPLPELELVPESGAEVLETRARAAEERLTEVVEAYRKLKTDNEAFRDRTTRNLERRFEQRRESLLLKFIDILDNMDRALDAAQTAYADPSLLEGLILVRTQLLQTLQEEGLERIPVLGLPFDPNFSEAVGTAPVEEAEHHHVVVKELMRGYRLNGRVARASRVVIGEHGKPVPVEIPATDLIGADEVPLEAEPEAEENLPEAHALDDESTLEEIIAEAQTKRPAAAAEDEPVVLGDVLLEPEEKE
jgi:molecular chaperone GrpE